MAKNPANMSDGALRRRVARGSATVPQIMEVIQRSREALDRQAHQYTRGIQEQNYLARIRAERGQ